MYTAKDYYIELIAEGVRPEDIDEELLLAMMDEERESIELQASMLQEQEADHDQNLPSE